jgi:hypothetical protein
LSKRKQIALVVAVLAAVGVGIEVGRLGDLGRLDSRIASAHSDRAFDAAVWRTNDVSARGEMLAALAERHRFVGFHRDSVEALLGPGECYVAYEDEPCYLLQLGHSLFQLEFPVNHSSSLGQVLGMRLDKR